MCLHLLKILPVETIFGFSLFIEVVKVHALSVKTLEDGILFFDCLPDRLLLMAMRVVFKHVAQFDSPILSQHALCVCQLTWNK